MVLASEAIFRPLWHGFSPPTFVVASRLFPQAIPNNILTDVFFFGKNTSLFSIRYVKKKGGLSNYGLWSGKTSPTNCIKIYCPPQSVAYPMFPLPSMNSLRRRDGQSIDEQQDDHPWALDWQPRTRHSWTWTCRGRLEFMSCLMARLSMGSLLPT